MEGTKPLLCTVEVGVCGREYCEELGWDSILKSFPPLIRQASGKGTIQS